MVQKNSVLDWNYFKATIFKVSGIFFLNWTSPLYFFLDVLPGQEPMSWTVTVFIATKQLSAINSTFELNSITREGVGAWIFFRFEKGLSKLISVVK